MNGFSYMARETTNFWARNRRKGRAKSRFRTETDFLLQRKNEQCQTEGDEILPRGAGFEGFIYLCFFLRGVGEQDSV